MWVLWDKSWLWDIKHCWYNYPHHSVEKDVWWYYMIELSFYWSLCFSQVTAFAKLSLNAAFNNRKLILDTNSGKQLS
jgi:hypothetical protein